ncbi:MAG TPA: aminotransferase class IV [Pyrinomonadaceae bacterium]|nr:aminotransferase class IV [Pyrinomonadaceae bacterium]
MISTTNAALYGKGVFTTISFQNFTPLFWEKHWRRLSLNAGTLDIDISGHDEPSTRELVIEAIRQFGQSAGRVRVSFLDNSTSEIWGGKAAGTALLSIMTGPFRDRPPALNLTVSPHRISTTSPLAGVKSCNYLEPLMSLDEARSRGFDEAIKLNERGEIASACMANVFWLKGDNLFTPSLRTGCLNGTTREHILENLECEEVEISVEALREADEVFLSSAGLGVVQANDLDGRSLAKRHHKILDLLPKTV